MTLTYAERLYKNIVQPNSIIAELPPKKITSLDINPVIYHVVGITEEADKNITTIAVCFTLEDAKDAVADNYYKCGGLINILPIEVNA